MSDAHPARADDDRATAATPPHEPAPRRAIDEPAPEASVVDELPQEKPAGEGISDDDVASSPSTPHDAEADQSAATTPTTAAHSRPARPPIVANRAEVVEHTRPGRIQVASERFWTAAIVLGIVGILTALVTHGHAVDELAAKAHPGDPEEVRRAAANILHFTMIGIVGAGLLPEAILATFLGGRRVIVRVVLSALALGAALILPLALEVLGPSGWRGTVIQVCIVGHAALALIASVLMWLPKGRRVKKK